MEVIRMELPVRSVSRDPTAQQRERHSARGLAGRRRIGDRSRDSAS